MPVLDNDELAKLKQLDGWRGFKSATLPMLFPAAEGAAGMEQALDDALRRRPSRRSRRGEPPDPLRPRRRRRDRADPVAAGAAGLHHHLVRRGLRTRAGLIVECGDAREVHHFALLLGYGAGTINPYVAFETLDDMIRQGLIKAEHRPRRGGLPLPQGDQEGGRQGDVQDGHQHDPELPGGPDLRGDRPEPGVRRPVLREDRRRGSAAIGLEEIAAETLYHHHRAYADREVGPPMLDEGGQYQWRRDGEYHLFNPETVFKLQHATQAGRYDIFKKYTQLVDEQNERLCTLRGLFAFKLDRPTPVPIEEVEPVESIVKRFATGAMSYGSISGEAHETLAIAMNRLGGRSNTGEGGEDPARFMPMPNGDSKRSAIKQVASGRFGVTSEYLVNADEIQIKMAQGAKPGEGGQLPGHKVWPWIAKVRHSTPGVGLISPPPHHDIYSIEDLAQLIHDLKNANPRARISVKLVAEVGVGTVAAGVAKAHSDVVLISRPRRRHRRQPADLAQARRHPLGAGPRRDAADARAEPAPRPDRRPGRRPAEDRPRRRDRRAARRRGVRLRDRAPGRDGLHHDAGLPPRHLPGRASPRRTRSSARSSPARPSTSSTSSGSSPRRSAS